MSFFVTPPTFRLPRRTFRPLILPSTTYTFLCATLISLTYFRIFPFVHQSCCLDLNFVDLPTRYIFSCFNSSVSLSTAQLVISLALLKSPVHLVTASELLSGSPLPRNLSRNPSTNLQSTPSDFNLLKKCNKWLFRTLYSILAVKAVISGLHLLHLNSYNYPVVQVRTKFLLLPWAPT